MARDRLLELQQRTGNTPTIAPAAPAAPAAAAAADPEAGGTVTISRPSRLARMFRRPAAAAAAAAQQSQPDAQWFQQELAEISTALADSRSAVEEVSRQQCRQLNSPRHQQQAWHQTRDSSAALLSKIGSIKTKLDRLQKKLTEAVPELTTTQAKMLQNQVNTYRTQLLAVVQHFNEEEVAFRQKKKDHLKRQLQITGAEIGDDELENLLDQGDVQIFNESILMRVETARAELNEAEDRYEQIRALETSIEQLHEMFLQLSILVQQQGEMVDRIEDSTVQTEVKTKQATKELRSALQKKQRSRKMCIGCGIFGGVLLLILVIILLTYVG